MRDLLIILFFLSASPNLRAQEFLLLGKVQVDRQGIFLSQLVEGDSTQPLPRLFLTNSPAFGSSVYLSKAEIIRLARALDTNLFSNGLKGPERVQVVRAARALGESDLKTLLTATLQSDFVKDRGEIEIRLMRPWKPFLVPDDSLSVKLLELPNSGVAAQFIAKFEIIAGAQSFGIFSLPLQASLWQEVYVAADTLLRGQLLRELDLSKERRDLFTTRDALTELPFENPFVELAENIRPGAPITSRSLRLRTVVKRGRVLDAQLSEGAMKLTAKVEALEDGIPGQVVRVRNIRSKRELRGKVQDEQTIQVLF